MKELVKWILFCGAIICVTVAVFSPTGNKNIAKADTASNSWELVQFPEGCNVKTLEAGTYHLVVQCQDGRVFETY